MFDHPKFAEAVAELTRLNANLETLHRDLEDLKPLKSDVRLAAEKLGELQGGVKAAAMAAKELRVLNMILIQVKKVSGWSGVVRHILGGLASMAKGGRA